MNIITFDGVGFGFPGQTPILSRVNFSLNTGNRILILGQNGSGKSTLAFLASALRTPTSGTIRYGNTGGPESIRIGMLFQNSRYQTVGVTVEEDLAFGLHGLKLTGQEMRNQVDKALNSFNLTSKRYHGVHQLSGGELRRLALAAVVITRPHLLILDEPLAMLDGKNKTNFLKCLEQEVDPETGIIWFDHEVKSVRYFKQWFILADGTLTPVTTAELNDSHFIQTHHLTPTPLQPLEWAYPNQVKQAIWGPERIYFDSDKC